MAMHARRMSFDRRREVLPWVYAIARHKLVDRFRDQSRTEALRDLCDSGETASFEAEVIARIDIDRILAGLTGKQRAAIQATKIDGLSVAEAAQANRWTETDVKVSVHRGLKLLASRIRGF
jgi:RNA polymerase sigma-70 factor (ECF subfamily)